MPRPATTATIINTANGTAMAAESHATGQPAKSLRQQVCAR